MSVCRYYIYLYVYGCNLSGIVCGWRARLPSWTEQINRDFK